MSRPLDRLARVRQARIEAGLRRTLHPRSATFDGLLDLASNDYLGLTRDPRVARAAAEAAQAWGTGATGSRLVTGTTALHADTEAELADFVGVEAALLTSSGYLANLAAVTSLTGPSTTLLSDAVNHASIVDACRLSRARVRVLDHRSDSALRDAIANAGEGTDLVVVTDAVFSVDGEAAHLPEVFSAADTADALTIVDEAHSLGVCGDGGRGLAHGCGPADPRHVLTATLSKAFASQGGAVLGSQVVIDHVIDQARPFIFDTGLAPPSVAAAREALRIIRAEPDLPAAACANAGYLSSLATSLGLDASTPDAAVVSIRIGRPQDALMAQQVCRDHGVLVGCFRPPSVPDDDSRLRLTARADLDEPALAQVGAALAAVAARLTG